MYKKILQFTLATLASLFIAACSTSDDLTSTSSDADVISVAVTRTPTTSGTFNDGDEICIYNATRRKATNEKYSAIYQYSASTNTWTPTSTGLTWYRKSNVTSNTLYAVIPKTAPYENFDLPKDQSTADKLKAADWQMDEVTVDDLPSIGGDYSSVNFTLSHQMAKLKFTITAAKDDATNLNSNSFSVFGVVTPYYDATAHTVEAIIDPKWRIPTTTPIITITTTDNETLSVPIPSEITGFEAGKQYNFNLAIGHNALTISSVSVTDWTPIDLNGKNEAWNKDDDDTEYITFSADSEQGFLFVNPSEYPFDLPGFEYSVDNGEWKPIPDGGLDDAVSFGGALGNLRLRGISYEGTYGSRTVKFTKNNVKVACSGDIRTLIDYTHYKTVDTGDAMFCSLFKNCTQLTSAPMLPSTELAAYCYQSMFEGCSSLTIAPVLPARELSVSCYSGMFNNCTSLVSPPIISASTLAEYCCQCMFEGCTALKKASVPPAEILANCCYSFMFKDCTALTTPPVLPATDLAIACYGAMFEGCTSLKSAPALPAATLANDCYGGMFRGCTSLKTAPALPATTLAEQCYIEMFNGCTSLKTAPALPATTLAVRCYQLMFHDCTALTNSPELSATTLADFCCLGMFSDCTALSKAPLLKAEELKRDCYNQMFSNCSNLSSVTMLATDVNAQGCLNDWLTNAGTSATSRTLKLKNSSVYDAIKDNPRNLPDNWKSGQATIIYEENP